jgi:hypothetical protein
VEDPLTLPLVLSGLFGLAIHDLLPRATRPNQELRLENVEAGFHRLYVEAEEAVLGHSEDLVHAYLRNVRPLLIWEQSPARLIWAVLRGCVYPKPKPGRIDDGARRGSVSQRCDRSSASAGSLEHPYPMTDGSGLRCSTKSKP